MEQGWDSGIRSHSTAMKRARGMISLKPQRVWKEEVMKVKFIYLVKKVKSMSV